MLIIIAIAKITTNIKKSKIKDKIIMAQSPNMKAIKSIIYYSPKFTIGVVDP